MLLERALENHIENKLEGNLPQINNHQKKTYLTFPMMSYESERDQGEGRGKHRTCWEIQEEEGTWEFKVFLKCTFAGQCLPSPTLVFGEIAWSR